MKMLILLYLISFLTLGCEGNPHAKRLYDDLLHNYNRLIRPVSNFTDTLVVKLGLKLSQIIDVDLKNQVMTTNVWVDQTWMDYKLRWDPEINVEWFPFDEQSCDMKFGSWTYDGNQVDLKHMNQEPGNNVVAIGIDLSEFYLSVEWDILEVPATKNIENYEEMERISEDGTTETSDSEYPDKLLTGKFFILLYTQPLQLENQFWIMERKRMSWFRRIFTVVFLLFLALWDSISFLTVLVFYLPSDSGEKVTLCISILLSLTVFFLLLAEIIPPTSLAVPLLGKYLVFTMVLVTMSISSTVGVLNIHFRTPATHNMPDWVKQVFLIILPRILMMRRPQYTPRYSMEFEDQEPTPKKEPLNCIDNNSKATQVGPTPFLSGYHGLESPKLGLSPEFSEHTIPCDSEGKMGHEYIKQNGNIQCGHGHSSYEDDIYSSTSSSSLSQHQFSPDVLVAMKGVQFIAQHIRKNDQDIEIIEDWKYIAMVLDRLFLWLFTISCIIGFCGIILMAPSLYDMREPIDAKYTTIGVGGGAM